MQFTNNNLQFTKRDSSFVRGQSLFELVLAIGISSIMIVVIVSLVNNALQGANFAKSQTLAIRYAESASEWLRAQRDADIVTFLTHATGTWCLKDDPLTNTSWNQHNSCATTDVISGSSFVRQVVFTVTTPAPSLKTLVLANTTVTWTDSKGTHTITNATQFTDWRQR